MADSMAERTVDVELLKSRLSQSLEQICQQCFVYVDYVAITGKLMFKVDQTQKTDVNISQMVLPGPLLSPPSPPPTTEDEEYKTVVVVNPEPPEDVTCQEPVVSPPKRGRPRLSSTPVQKKKPVTPASSGSSTSNKRKRGRPKKNQLMDIVESITEAEEGNVMVQTSSSSALNKATREKSQPVTIKKENKGFEESEQGTESTEVIGGLDVVNNIDMSTSLESEVDTSIGMLDVSETVVHNEEDEETDDALAFDDDVKDKDFVPTGKHSSDDMDETEPVEGRVKKKKPKVPRKKRENKDRYYLNITSNPLECYRCHFMAETEEGLKEHKISTHGKFLCELCPYVTDSKFKLQCHVDGKHTDRTWPCPECGKEFSQEDSLKKHQKQIHAQFWKCPECDPPRPHTTRKKMLGHMRNEHSKSAKDLYICDMCKIVVLKKADYETHRQKMHNHVCETCKKRFDTQTLLTRHRLEVHPEEALKCEECGRLCPSKSALYKHVDRHKEKAMGKFECELCFKEFTSKSSLFHHRRGLHGQEKKYKCEQCGKEFNFHHSLKLHVYKHTGQRPHQCKFCHKSYLTSNHLKNHVEAVHSGTKKYVCPVCNKGFPYDNSLRMHMLLHDDDRPFVCTQCGKSFVAKSALKAHEDLHTSEMHKCTVCGKLYRTKMLLRAHMRRHTDEGHRYMCDICGNTFMYQSTLATHMIVHGNSRTFECKTCNKTFKTYATLYSHRLVHEEGSSFSCKICGKGFKTRERVKAHERRHTGEKPFACHMCGACFPDRGGLTKHHKTVHARRPRFQCPSCGKMANRADNLRVHMKIHNDPKLMELSFEELQIKIAAGDEPEYDEHAPVPVNRRRRTGLMKLKKEPRVNQNLHESALAPNVSVVDMNHSVNSSTSEMMTNSGEHIVTMIPTEITFTVDKVTAEDLIVSHMNKVQQQQPDPAHKDLTLSMHKHMVDIQEFEKLQKQQTNQATAVHTMMQTTTNNTHESIEIQNTGNHGNPAIPRLEQIVDMNTIASTHSTIPQQQQQHINNSTVITNNSVAASNTLVHNNTVITNPLLHLAEVMSGAAHHHPITSTPGGSSYATLQQYPFVLAHSEGMQQTVVTTGGHYQPPFQQSQQQQP